MSQRGMWRGVVDSSAPWLRRRSAVSSTGSSSHSLPSDTPSQALQELAKTRQVLIFDNALTGLSGVCRSMRL